MLGVTVLNRRILARGLTPVKIKMATGLAKEKENQAQAPCRGIWPITLGVIICTVWFKTFSVL